MDPEAGNLWRAYVDAYAGRVESVREAAARADSGEPIVTALWSRCLGLAELAAGGLRFLNDIPRIFRRQELTLLNIHGAP